MIDARKLIPLGCVALTIAMASAQTPPPAPPAPPAPVAVEAPPAPLNYRPTPRPAPAPRALPADLFDADQIREMAEQAREMAEQATPRAMDLIDREQLREMAEEARAQAKAAMSIDADQVREMAAEARAKALANRDFIYQGGGGGFALARPTPMPAMPPMLAQTKISIGRGNEDSQYNAGHRALDNHKYDEALEYFNQVAARAGNRADAAWYFKAYTLRKLGRRDEALAAIAELRKSYASSRWLDDAKALELEVKQDSGQRVSPETESDEELKLMAINGIMQSDPDKAIPLLENILKSSQPPKVKNQALFVLAQSSAPRAQQVIEQIARGGANPDLQLKAISYLSQRRRGNQGPQNPNLLLEVYGSTNDLAVKRAIVNAWESYRDKDKLAQVAKTEKNPELRRAAFQGLASNNPGQPELWPILQAETNADARQEILRCMYQDGNVDKLTEVVKTEKDPKTRRVAVEVLASQKSGNAPDLLVSVYNSEQDPQLKQVIVDHLSGERNAKYLVALARNEKDSKMKLRIVERLSNMHSKEASDYLAELLSK